MSPKLLTKIMIRDRFHPILCIQDKTNVLIYSAIIKKKVIQKIKNSKKIMRKAYNNRKLFKFFLKNIINYGQNNYFHNKKLLQVLIKKYKNLRNNFKTQKKNSINKYTSKQNRALLIKRINDIADKLLTSQKNQIAIKKILNLVKLMIDWFQEQAKKTLRSHFVFIVQCLKFQTCQADAKELLNTMKPYPLVEDVFNLIKPKFKIENVQSNYLVSWIDSHLSERIARKDQINEITLKKLQKTIKEYDLLVFKRNAKQTVNRLLNRLTMFFQKVKVKNDKQYAPSQNQMPVAFDMSENGHYKTQMLKNRQQIFDNGLNKNNENSSQVRTTNKNLVYKMNKGMAKKSHFGDKKIDDMELPHQPSKLLKKRSRSWERQPYLDSKINEQQSYLNSIQNNSKNCNKITGMQTENILEKNKQ